MSDFPATPTDVHYYKVGASSHYSATDTNLISAIFGNKHPARYDLSQRGSKWVLANDKGPLKNIVDMRSILSMADSCCGRYTYITADDDNQVYQCVGHEWSTCRPLLPANNALNPWAIALDPNSCDLLIGGTHTNGPEFEVLKYNIGTGALTTLYSGEHKFYDFEPAV